MLKANENRCHKFLVFFLQQLHVKNRKLTITEIIIVNYQYIVKKDIHEVELRWQNNYSHFLDTKKLFTSKLNMELKKRIMNCLKC